MTSHHTTRPETELPFIMVFATRLEAEPFISALRMTPMRSSPVPTFGRGNVVLTVSGIGKTNAAIATACCCSTFLPRWVLNFGCAGAANSAYKKGDIFQILKAIEPDRPHLRSGTPHVHVPSVLSGFAGATLATQDRPVISRKDRKCLSDLVDLVDMEGAAIIQTARKFGVPPVLFKFVSDAVGDEDGPSIIRYVREYGNEFCRFVVESVIPVLLTTLPVTLTR